MTFQRRMLEKVKAGHDEKSCMHVPLIYVCIVDGSFFHFNKREVVAIRYEEDAHRDDYLQNSAAPAVAYPCRPVVGFATRYHPLHLFNWYVRT